MEATIFVQCKQCGRVWFISEVEACRRLEAVRFGATYSHLVDHVCVEAN